MANQRSIYKTTKTVSLPVALVEQIEKDARNRGSDFSSVIREEIAPLYGMSFDERGKKITKSPK